MANEIQFFDDGAQTLYAALVSATGTVWNGAALVAIAAEDWADYAIPVTEATAGIYLATMPAVTAGDYQIACYKQIGATAAISDTLLGNARLSWDGTAPLSLAVLHERLADQVPAGPVVVVPAPAAGQTTAWAMCYDEDGAIEKDAEIYIQCVGASGTAAAYDATPLTIKSDATGLAAGPIPRNASLTFTARRGDGGRRVRFTGANADSLALPALIGTP